MQSNLVGRFAEYEQPVLQYVDLEGRQEEIKLWLEQQCAKLQLVGRIRVAKDGINVTARFYPGSWTLL